MIDGIFKYDSNTNIYYENIKFDFRYNKYYRIITRIMSKNFDDYYKNITFIKRFI